MTEEHEQITEPVRVTVSNNVYRKDFIERTKSEFEEMELAIRTNALSELVTMIPEGLGGTITTEVEDDDEFNMRVYKFIWTESNPEPKEVDPID